MPDFLDLANRLANRCPLSQTTALATHLTIPLAEGVLVGSPTLLTACYISVVRYRSPDDAPDEPDEKGQVSAEFRRADKTLAGTAVYYFLGGELLEEDLSGDFNTLWLEQEATITAIIDAEFPP